jgi:hypothetical protein
VALDVFNVFNDRSKVVENTALDGQVDHNYAVPFAAALQLVDPRRIRVGAEYHF